jgi:hypothetical protein
MGFHGEALLAPRPTPSWRTTPRRLFATAYSIYSQLPSISEAVPPSATWGRAMPWWQGPTSHGHTSYIRHKHPRRPSKTAQFASTVTNQTVKAIWENNCLLSESRETHKYNEYTECRRFTDKPGARIIREAASVKFVYTLATFHEYHTERITELPSYRYEGNDKINREITTLSAFKSINRLYLFSVSSVQD